MDNQKFDQWVIAIEAWKAGAVVTHFLRDQIAALRDADGDPIPEAARQFFADLIFCRIRPRRGRAISKTIVRRTYRDRLFFEQVADQQPHGDPPHERAIQSLASELGMSEAAVSQIVHPREARAPKKPQKV